ncbi:MAG: acyltransferase [Proteobacteria bacterium]|nr:acyltransferase [Pseudomonadota bacterium]
MQYIKNFVKRNEFLMKIYLFMWPALEDLKTKRIRTAIPLYIGNLLPDLFFCDRIRAVLLCIAGARLEEINSSMVRQGFFIECASNLSAGKHFHVNRNSYFCGNDKIDIGCYVTISHNAQILTMHHRGEKHEQLVFKPVVIKDYCIIYAGAIILPGTVLEQYVVVGAGAVISGQTKPGGIYKGNPAQFIGFRRDVDLNGS